MSVKREFIISLSLLFAVYIPFTAAAAPTCTFQGGATTGINLILDPVGSGNITATNSPALTMLCKGGNPIAYSISIVSGGTTLTGGNGPACPCTIPYTFSILSAAPASPVPNNTLVTVTTQALVPIINFQDKPTGTYSDTVVLQVTP
jgi:hypothetical protein